MKIGIFLSSRKPTDGGGYTITKDLFDSLIYLYPKEDFFFIIRGKENDYFIKKIIQNGFEYTIINDSKILIFLKTLVINVFKNSFFLNFGLNKILKENKVSVLIFLSSENFYPVKIPYITTIWDIQHFTNSKFKETGSFFVKLFRYVVLNINLKFCTKIISGTDIGIRDIKKYYNVRSKKFYKLSHPTPKIFLKEKKQKTKISFKDYFIYPANFWQHKNHLFLLKAVFEINKKYQDKIKLILVGSIKDKLYFNKIKRFINENKLKKNVIILNFVSVKKLIQLYDNCNALVYTSTSGPENLPPLESFARGKNVIISNYPGAKEQLNVFANYFELGHLEDLKKKLLCFDRYDQKKLKNYAMSKSTENYIKKLITNIYKDFRD